MERIIKILIFVSVIFLSWNTVIAEEMTLQQLTTPTNIMFDNCTKSYNIPADNLYYLTLDSLAANRFEIKELQSKTGYILFKAAGREFLVTIAYYGPNKSILRITPANNNYYFAPGITSNIFKYIDLNINAEINPISKS